MIKFKVKSLDRTISCLPGDTLNLTYTEVNYLGGKNEQLLHSEAITEIGDYCCFAVLKLPVGMGLILGKDVEELRAFLNETWPGCECDPEEGIL